MRLVIACLAVLLGPACALAEAYIAPAPGTRISYGTYEGGDTPFIERIEIVVVTDEHGYVALVEPSNGDRYLTRSLYGFTGYTCLEGGHQFAQGIDTLWPLKAGTMHPDGAFLVIGKDVDVWVNNAAHDAWAVREITEHGTMFVTRVAPALGIGVDDLVGLAFGPAPAVTPKAVACLTGY